MIDLNVGGRVNTEGQAATYGVSGVANTPAATPTDIVTLYGSATKTVKIKRVTVSGQATTAGSMPVSLVKRTAVNTTGTSSAPSIAKFDSTDGAATATPLLYTANPSALGAGVMVASQTLNMGVAGAADTVYFDFSNRNDKAIYLHGVAEGLAINLNGATVPTAGTFGYTVEFEEL
ncbi:MAG: hypothetical protein WCQ87_03750 [Parabacteroides sp.]